MLALGLLLSNAGCVTPRCGAAAEVSTERAGAFEALTGDNLAQCALRANGTLTCWGAAHGAPGGTFRQVAAGKDQACGVDTSGRLACWGPFGGNHRKDLPEGEFSEVSVAEKFACARRTDGQVLCWSRSEAPFPMSLPFPASRIAVYEHRSSSLNVVDGLLGGPGITSRQSLRVCVVGSEGQALCVAPKSSEGGFEPAAERQLIRIVASEVLGCGIDRNDELICWRNDDHRAVIVSPPLPARVRDVDTASSSSVWRLCVLTDDGRPQCWSASGAEDGMSQDYHCAPPEGKFRQISVGITHTCALREDGRIVCWGLDAIGERTPP
jgi:hypothetical protein